MEFEEFKEKYGIDLNEQQWAAVKSVENPTLLLAVPGSGKTTVLVTRLGYMINCCGIKPEEILTITYTVAATNDMKNRFASIFGEELAGRLEFRTINGICAKIISSYSRDVGKKSFELMTDEGNKAKMLTAICIDRTKEYPSENDLKNVSQLITYIKNMQLEKDRIEKLGKDAKLPLYEIFSDYCSEMRKQSLMDYDDQMVYAYTMLNADARLLEDFQNKYKYICVDEAQDTSKIQHQIISLLAKKYEHLFMVGDEDQSIYGFRAAYPEAILTFEKKHENANVLLMEKNYRSNAKIVNAANGFIQKNQFRHRKIMTPAREEGADIRDIEIKSRRAQYTYLAKVAANCKEETAVLYRDNESMLALVDLLERNEADYRIKNADITFFSNKVVNDVKNIINFAYNPTDIELFMQIYYKVSTYISKSAAIEACRTSKEMNIPVLDAALEYGKLAPGTIKHTKEIQTHFKELLEDPADRALYRIVNYMGYSAYLDRMNINDSKLQILDAIGFNEPTPIRLIERLDELADIIREKKNNPECKFILSTIHSSKGLEYDTVYLMDVMDGIFPETPMKNRDKATSEELRAYEEERRLYYVGVTRAKNNLNIFSFKHNSIFTDELLGKNNKPEVKSHARKNILLSKSAQSQSIVKKTIIESDYLSKMEEIKNSGHVKHKTFGDGKVISFNGDTIEIAFASRTAKCKLKFLMENGLIV